MLRFLVALLLVANLAWAAWSQGWLGAVGMPAGQQGEPQRLARQLRPEAVGVQPLTGAAAELPRPPAPVAAPALPELVDQPAPPPVPDALSPASVVAAAAEPPAVQPPPAEPAAQPASAAPRGACLQAGPFDDKQIEAVRRAAAALPAGGWRVEPAALSSRWMVYIGKLADADAVRAKRSELRALGVDTDRPSAAWEPGLSLGRFSNEESAQRALTDLGRKGVHTARVVQERRDTSVWLLRLPDADPALRQQARASLRGALGDKELRACE
jgi:hypothetical protein